MVFNMVWIVDIALAIIILLPSLDGAINGLVKTLIKLASFAVASLAGWFGGRYAAQWIYSAFVRERLVTVLGNKILEYNESGKPITLLFGLENRINVDSVTNITVQSDAQSAAEGLVDSIVGPAVQTIMHAVLLIIIFIIVTVIFAIVIKAAKHVNDVPVLGTLNRVAGILFGLVCGMLISAAVVAVFTAILQYAGGSEGEAMQFLRGSVLFNWFYDLRLFEKIGAF